MTFKYINLSQGKRAKVSIEDFAYLNQYNWYYLKAPKDSYGYAVCSTFPYRNKKMHRVILKAKNGEVVDHINHNGLDNRRTNIRITTVSNNNFNRRVKNKLGLRGVTECNKGGFITRITFEGKRLYLGHFNTAKEASKVYENKRKEFYNGI